MGIRKIPWLVGLVALSVMSSSLVAGQIRDGEGNELPRQGDEDVQAAAAAGVYHDNSGGPGAGQEEGDALSVDEKHFKQAQDIRAKRDSTQADKLQAYSLLRQAGVGHAPSIAARAEMHLEGIDSSGVPFDLLEARQLFSRAASMGEPSAQDAMGFFYAMGIAGLPQDTPRALLNYYFAAAGNETEAQLALGFRHMHGVGVPKSCQAAVLYYQPAAEHVIRAARSPGGFPVAERIRLSLDMNAHYNPSREEDMLQYYQYSADMGNVDAQTAIGQLFNFGARGMDRDHQQALLYFRRAAAQGDADALAHLGHMHANGLGVPRNNATALEYFRKAAEKGHPNALYGMGYMHLAGFGVPKDAKKAHKFFTEAAEHGNAEAQFHLGVMSINGWGVQQDLHRAFYHFNLAGHSGHLLALYNLAVMQLTGQGASTSCKGALGLLKGVAERGPWSLLLQEAHAHFRAGREAQALLLYLKTAEIGIEVGQSNAAWMMERGMGTALGPVGINPLALHRRAADQGNVESLLFIGDAYYYGRGGLTEPDYEKSAAVYRQASQARSAQAMFNLGTMHEAGTGLPKDLHLAKRYYDMAKQTHDTAFVPVTLALFKLQVHQAWEDRWAAKAAEGLAKWEEWRPWVEANFESILLGVLCLLLLRVELRRRRNQQARAEAAARGAEAAGAGAGAGGLGDTASPVPAPREVSDSPVPAPREVSDSPVPAPGGASPEAPVPAPAPVPAAEPSPPPGGVGISGGSLMSAAARAAEERAAGAGAAEAPRAGEGGGGAQ